MIIHYLNSNRTYNTSYQISKYLGVSERSIKRYIKDINQIIEKEGAIIQSSKGLGYKLNIIKKEKFNKYMKSRNLKFDNRTIKSIDLLINILLNEPISLDELSEKMYCSRSTLQNNIVEVKQYLNEYNIELIHKPYKGLILHGDEENIRKCIVKYCFDDTHHINDCDYTNYIKSDFVKEIKCYITKYLLNNNILKNSYEVKYLVNYILICFFRSIKGNKINRLFIENINDDVYLFADDFIKYIKNRYKILIDKHEIIYINTIIQSKKYILLNKILKEDYVSRIVMNSLIDLDTRYESYLSYDTELLKNLTNHIMNSYHRYYLGFNVENTILDQIKRNYPQSIDYAIGLSKNIEDEFKIRISENELGYIAIHFASSIERMNKDITYKAIILCNIGSGTYNFIKAKLNRYYPNIKVIGNYEQNYESLHLNDFSDIDFIISTIKNIDIESKFIIKVSPMLTNNDIELIDDKINNIYFHKYVKNKFNELAFYPNLQIKDKEELIEYITNDMLHKNLISYEDKYKIVERENRLSTEISDLVAFPHCISDSNNIIAICMMDRPIKYGNKEVKIIFIAVSKHQNENNKNIFSFINSKIQTLDDVNKLCKSKNLNEFIDILTEL